MNGSSPSTLSHIVLSLCSTHSEKSVGVLLAFSARLSSVFQQVGGNKFFPFHGRFKRGKSFDRKIKFSLLLTQIRRSFDK